MTRYLTPSHFKALGTGADVADISDAELATILHRAADIVDNYCLVPSLPVRYSFRGGTVEGDSSPWGAGQSRVWPSHRPMKALNSFRIYATNDVYLTISPNELFIGPGGAWAEIVALSLTPVGFWASTGLVSLSRPIARINYTYGYEFTATDEMMHSQDQQEYHAQNQFWDPDPVIKVDGSVVTTGFSLNETEGGVTFDEALSSDQLVTASYTHSLPSGVAQAVGIIATSLISERDLIGKGLGNLAEISVEEVRLRRDARRTGTLVVAAAVPDTARALLDPYRFIPVR